ncbi:MAG: endonuclease VIII [Clostridiales bacterium]|jgi:formamidopyrimidine-DNA glycosylase|nr:endonuclease VIII [Clostridiales bacterium]
MIELPEAYVLSEQINKTLTGKTITAATANAFPHGFAFYSGDPAAYGPMLTGKTITSSNPGTGYTCGGNVEIICGDMLLVISTPIKYHEPGAKGPAKHQLLLEFDDGSRMSCTVQMWGSMLCYPPDSDTPPPVYTINKCPSPLSEAFDRDYFMWLFDGLKPSLSAKAFLATEQRIPGLGNGALQDILFNARIHPKRKLETLSAEDKERMFDSVRSTLAAMRDQGGRDTEKDLFNEWGGYSTVLSNKTAAAPCPVCGGPIVKEAFLGGKVYYCPVCQK